MLAYSIIHMQATKEREERVEVDQVRSSIDNTYTRGFETSP